MVLTGIGACEPSYSWTASKGELAAGKGSLAASAMGGNLLCLLRLKRNHCDRKKDELGS